MIYPWNLTAQQSFGENTEACTQKIQEYRDLFDLDCAGEKGTDNEGNGIKSLYGTRNFRTILHGVAYRGGGNNYYHRKNKRGNKNPLPNDGLQNLANLNFRAAVYLYTDNFEIAPSSMTGREGNVMDYYQISGKTPDEVRTLLELTYSSIMSPDNGPLYLHCWNGWHQSGYVSAILLRQFCGLSSEEAVQYWVNNTDTYNKGYTRIKTGIADFLPHEDLLVSRDVQHEICPCMGEGELTPVMDDDAQEKMQNTLSVKVPFESNSSEITPGSLTIIDEYIVLLKDIDFISIEVGGHSSAPGAFETNQKLSEDRARLVYDYLVTEGISDDRLTYKGYGESQLLDTRDVKEAHDANRRIEFTVTGLDLEITFPKNSSNLPLKVDSQLWFLREILLANPAFKARIVGHTDITGSAARNLELSKARAKVVYDFLVKIGVSEDQLFYEGLGASQPRYSNETEVGRSMNRRIEISLD